ncbi:hypothetical protein [Bradyrhizobium sp. SZCCHNS2015]|uniref:hypothetical protein n=1 Tax=Bradyrhizobium sp. SZCCHNS2015 TaxID=3057305 RepID=UPI0028E98A89|nr:hypothetical protein [Bradyrhizobium sp. SZCCHNS2015]
MKRRPSVVDVEIARKAAKLRVPSMEERYVARALGDELVREVLQWARLQGAPDMDLSEAIRKLVELGLKAKR